ncbi:neutral zinc metallopeptidase [Streptomyces anandii]|uniref:neutral zinc metallopeptidase n=1 Tax=Streptomyces anandii TaxID=285454 RepID=UPI0037031C18
MSVGLLSSALACAPVTSGSPGGVATPVALSADQLAIELDHLQLMPEKDGTSAPRGLKNPTTQEVVTYLRSILQDLDTTWSDFFKRLGLEHRQVKYVLVTPQQHSVTSRCSGQKQMVVIRHDTPNATFCRADRQGSPAVAGTIYLPVTALQKVWEGDIFGRLSTQAGDHSVAVIAAHEFAHYVTRELQWQFQQRFAQYPLPTGKWKELLSDCMAGVWSAHTHLKPTDVREAVTALEKVGDYEVNSPGHHGTPQERKDAVLVGFNGIPHRYAPRTPAACVLKYWKT